MNIKKHLLIGLLSLIVVGGIILIVSGAANHHVNDDRPSVVVTSFVAYDSVRQIAGGKVNLQNLLSPGVEKHSYDPSPSDIIRIRNADLFIYVGGDIEGWTARVLETVGTENTKVLRLMEAINLIEKENNYYHGHSHNHHSSSHSHHHHHDEAEVDEHIWTSPANAILIINLITDKLVELMPEHEEIFVENANEYILEIKELQNEIISVVESASRRHLVFGDRMPMQYFLNEFGLRASAAFSGCGVHVEPSARVISDLVSVVRSENIPVVLHLEMSNGRIARTIADEVGIEIMQIHSMHNISRTEFENGETYVSLMRKNLEVLKVALN